MIRFNFRFLPRKLRQSESSDIWLENFPGQPAEQAFWECGDAVRPEFFPASLGGLVGVCWRWSPGCQRLLFQT